MIPSYLVSKMARENVTVALSGLGGDEAFGGYECYLGFQMSRYYNKMPSLIRKQLFQRVVEKNTRRLTAKVNHLKRFVRSSSLVEGERYLGFISKISEKYQHSFFWKDRTFERLSGLRKNAF